MAQATRTYTSNSPPQLLFVEFVPHSLELLSHCSPTSSPSKSHGGSENEKDDTGHSLSSTSIKQMPQLAPACRTRRTALSRAANTRAGTPRDSSAGRRSRDAPTRDHPRLWPSEALRSRRSLAAACTCIRTGVAAGAVGQERRRSRRRRRRRRRGRGRRRQRRRRHIGASNPYVHVVLAAAVVARRAGPALVRIAVALLAHLKPLEVTRREIERERRYRALALVNQHQADAAARACATGKLSSPSSTRLPNIHKRAKHKSLRPGDCALVNAPASQLAQSGNGGDRDEGGAGGGGGLGGRNAQSKRL